MSATLPEQPGAPSSFSQPQSAGSIRAVPGVGAHTTEGRPLPPHPVPASPTPLRNVCASCKEERAAVRGS